MNPDEGADRHLLAGIPRLTSARQPSDVLPQWEEVRRLRVVADSGSVSLQQAIGVSGDGPLSEAEVAQLLEVLEAATVVIAYAGEVWHTAMDRLIAAQAANPVRGRSGAIARAGGVDRQRVWQRCEDLQKGPRNARGTHAGVRRSPRSRDGA